MSTIKKFNELMGNTGKSTAYFDDSLFAQSHPSYNNMDTAALSAENIRKAMNMMKKFINKPIKFKPRPYFRIVPPELHFCETKYWIPYGNVVVLVDEEINYTFSMKRQAYVRDKRQNVDMPVTM